MNRNELTPAERLIVALDVAPDDALWTFERLRAETPVRWFKLRNRMFWQDGGLMLAKRIVRQGYNLMLDIKAYDTEDSIRDDVYYAFHTLGARFITVEDTRSVIKTAMEVRRRLDPQAESLKILAVPLLSDQPETSGNTLVPLDLIADGREAANEADGLICPPFFLPRWRNCGTTVTPAIRLDINDNWNNHKLACSPKQAIANGADYIIVGRPITSTSDPVPVVSSIIAGIAEGSTILP